MYTSERKKDLKLMKEWKANSLEKCQLTPSDRIGLFEWMSLVWNTRCILWTSNNTLLRHVGGWASH